MLPGQKEEEEGRCEGEVQLFSEVECLSHGCHSHLEILMQNLM